jgi:putative hydrolase of the HAD superfamily
VSDRGLGGDAEVSWLVEADDDWLAKRPEFLAGVRDRFALADSVEELLADYRADYPRRLPPPTPQTVAALRRLRAAGWRIGIVTNGEPTQDAVIRLTGLDEIVDGWAVSSIVGARKPDPAIFHAAAADCACALGDAVVVGDGPKADIAGAVACGLSSVWIERGRDWTEAGYAPTFRAASVAEAVVHFISS